jgi:hypothetical protein
VAMELQDSGTPRLFKKKKKTGAVWKQSTKLFTKIFQQVEKSKFW